MCGILGTFNPLQGAEALPLEAMGHRGPDASATWRSPDGRCWLGHVRLSIIELSDAGAQPMVSASGRTVIVFNGEIYNHLEIRSRLAGIDWRGDSDTETLLEAWEKVGAPALDWFRGMFAFAVYEVASGTLHLARDRLGIKPLYFGRLETGSLVFGSEVRAIGGMRPRLGAQALASYLGTGHLPASGSVSAEIEILLPGHLLRIDRGNEASVERWWPKKTGVLPKPTQAASFEGVRREVRALVEAAVHEHMLADVPIASFLSGGIDSSIVSLVAARHHHEPLRTFSVGFPQREFDERAVARLVAGRAGARHTEIEVGPEECLEWVVEAVEAMDVPSADSINTFIVSKAVHREGLKVALSGLGGDELFGGYPSFSDIPKLAWLEALPPFVAARLVGLLPAKVRDKLAGARSFDPFTLAVRRRNWWSPRHLVEAGIPVSLPELEPITPAADAFAAISWAEILGYMEPMLLRDSDQMSMAVSLELRVPLLDHRLVEYVTALPAKFKTGKPPKRLLIEAFRDILPVEVWRRPKQGFALPMDDWLRGPLKDFAETGIQSAKEILAPAFVQAAADRFDARQLHWTRYWQLAVLGNYSREK